MESGAVRPVHVKFISDDDIDNIFTSLNADGLCAAKTPKKQKKTDENFLHELSEVCVKTVHSKPSSLFETGDVAGQQIFGFQTPKRHNAVTNKVAESTSKTSTTPLQEKISGRVGRTSSILCSPSSCKNGDVRKLDLYSPSRHKSLASKTPVKSPPLLKNVLTTPMQSSQLSQKVSSHRKNHSNPKVLKKLQYSTDDRMKENSLCPQTPYNLRRRFKKKLVAVTYAENCYSDESDAKDFSESGSDWDSHSSDGSSTGSDGENEDNCETKVVLPKSSQWFGPSQSKNLKLSFVPAAEEYFQSHASKKVRTSNHTLGKLRYQLPQEELQELLSETTSSHEKQLAKLQNNSCSLFSKWNFMLREGFNILLYGVGSKSKLLSFFHQQLPEPSVIVNGFFPSLTIQEIVSAVADVLDLHGHSVDLLEMVDCIRNVFSQKKQIRLYLVVHNIDGIMLRNDKSQEVLARLSSTPDIHLIASIDHISAPLMWDQNMLSMFNFSWWDTTTFQPYVNETAFESSLLVQQSGNLALSSLQNVFRSLTNNAKSIYLLIAEHQKEHQGVANYNGMPFKKLYTSCRESLLVSSDLALRSQLTEFLDHRLVKSRRGPDGSELLIIPIDIRILDQFMVQQAAL